MPATRTERRILGGAVYRIRDARKIKQDTVAQKIGRHPAYLSNIERGKKQPSLETMVAIAAALEVDLDDISYLATVYLVCDHDDEAVA